MVLELEVLPVYVLFTLWLQQDFPSSAYPEAHCKTKVTRQKKKNNTVDIIPHYNPA